MENTLASRLPQPSVPALSATGGLVAAFFAAWLAVVLYLGVRGAFVASPGAPPLVIADRPGSAAQPVFDWIQHHSAIARIRPFSRPQANRGDTGLAMGRLRVPDCVFVQNPAWNLCVARWTGRYGDRSDRTAGVVVTTSSAGLCGEQEICGLEPCRHSGPYGRGQHRSTRAADRLQVFTDLFHLLPCRSYRWC